MHLPSNPPSSPNAPPRAPAGPPTPTVRPPHLQPPSLSEWNPGRQRSHFQPVTVALQVQVPESSHCRRREPGVGAGGRAQGIRGRNGASLAAGAAGPTHLPGGSRTAGRASRASSGRSSPGRAGSAARLCGRGSGGSARRGPCCGRAAGRTRTAQSGRCSCKLWAGGGGVSGRGMWQDGSPCQSASFCGMSRQLGEGHKWSSGPA